MQIEIFKSRPLKRTEHNDCVEVMFLDFDSKPPIWRPPSPRKKQGYHLSGNAQLCNKKCSESPLIVTQTNFTVSIKKKNSLSKAREDELKRQIEQWNPHKDCKIKGDPSSTLFLARLPYSANEEQIRAEFGIYGSIESIRIVEPQRGYAFVVFESPEGHEKAVSAVRRTAGGMLFHGRRIIVDLERGRLQMNWKPRRLGGGLGGRFSLARQRAEVARSHQIMRKGLITPNLELQGSKPAFLGSQRHLKPYERELPAPSRPQSHRFPKARTDTRSNSRFSRDDERSRNLRHEDKSGKPSTRVLRQY